MFLVNKPQHVLLITAVYFLLWILLRAIKSEAIHHPNAILVPGIFALTYAGWEWLVTVKTPEANIRFDLMLIWPLLFVLTFWSVFKTFLR